MGLISLRCMMVFQLFKHLDSNTIPDDSVLIDLHTINSRLKYRKDVIGGFRTNGRVRVIRTFGHQDIRDYNRGFDIIPKFSRICLNCQKKISQHNFYCNTSCSSSHININRSLKITDKIKNSIRLLQGKTTAEFVQESISLYGEQEYNYNEAFYINSCTKVKIYHNKCKKSFWQTPNGHSRGKGCPYCNQSKGEKLIFNILENGDVTFYSQWGFNKHKSLIGGGGGCLKFDFYLPEHNLCIEYDGEQHFEPVEAWGGRDKLKEIQHNDKIKDLFCLQNNIKLLRIPYWVNVKDVDILHIVEGDFTVINFYMGK